MSLPPDRESGNGNATSPKSGGCHDPQTCGIYDLCPACEDPSIDQPSDWERLRYVLRLHSFPEPLEWRRRKEVIQLLAELALTCKKDAEFGENVRGLLTSILSGLHPADGVDPPRIKTMREAATGYLDFLQGTPVPKGEPIDPPLSDRELRRLILSFRKKPGAGRALVRTLKHVLAMEDK